MKLNRLSILLAASLPLVACEKDTGGTPTVLPPLAYVRYVNGVNDLNSLDLRFVDFVEGSPNFTNVAFRQFTPYQAAYAGTRQLRLFTDPLAYETGQAGNGAVNVASPTEASALAAQVLFDSTMTLAPNTYYTLYAVGQSGIAPVAGTGCPPAVTGCPAVAGKIPLSATPIWPRAGGNTISLYLTVDTFPTVTNPPAATVFIRTVNLGQPLAAAQGLGPMEVYVARETDAILTTVAAPNGSTNLNVTPFPSAGGITPYATLTVRPTAPATSVYRWTTRAAGSGAVTSAATVSAFIGAQGSTTVNATGGAQTSGSILTGVLYPASKVGSAAPQTATFLVPAMNIMIDRNPPRTAP
jgi:hypothetical protein